MLVAFDSGVEIGPRSRGNVGDREVAPLYDEAPVSIEHVRSMANPPTARLYDYSIKAYIPQHPFLIVVEPRYYTNLDTWLRRQRIWP